jgi:hypothetical protein
MQVSQQDKQVYARAADIKRKEKEKEVSLVKDA